MLRLLQAPGQLDTAELQAIRLYSGMPQKLSDSNVALLDSLAARSVYNTSRRSSDAMSVAQIKERYSSAAMEGRPLRASELPVPTPSRSKLVQRLRGAALVIPTARWLSLRISTRTSSRLNDSTRCLSENRESLNKSTESDESEVEKIPASLALESPAPKISQLVDAASIPVLNPKTRQKSNRRSIANLWQETSEKLLPLVSKNNPVIGIVLDETRKQNTRAVKQTLQLLFNNEYIGLIAYAQCIIPVLYLLYMPALQALPNHVYYPTHYRYFGDAIEFEERMMVVGILALMQLLILVTLQVIVMKRFGISTIYQVAFVLESRFVMLQCRVLMWLVFAVQSTLIHYGRSLPFAATHWFL
ncbi:hypothetical protein AM587_10015062 [Phytophthora nicotianae]|nr:hypothetical protein AM587_10015062 [Phytophthora nicotianae]